MHQIRQNARPTIRERREKREPRSERERDDRASPRRRAARSSIDERRDHPTRDERARWSRSCTAPLVGAARRDLGSLSLIWALSSLSLFLSLFPEVIWSENEGRKWFPGQRWKYWSTGSHFPENDIFRDSQTLRFYGKWFPETVFTQFKHTLKHYFQTNYNNLSGLFIVEMVHGHLFK